MDVSKPTLRSQEALTGVVVALCVVLAGGCTPAAESPAPSPPNHARPPTRPTAGAKVINVALGRDRALVATAVRDLKAIGLWRDLTRHLYAVQLSTRRGPDRVPSDEHLADAVYTSLADEGGAGGLCDIVLFSTAIAADRRRQADYFAAGRLPRPPPSLRHFWGSLVAHELAHCLGDVGLGEPGARAWERRALRALEAGD